MPRPKNIEHPVRKMVSVSAETAQAIDDFRVEYSLATESKAIRRLIEAGLERLAAKPEKPGRGRPPLGMTMSDVDDDSQGRADP
ncbi:MAG TPA: hypothetical protein VMA53_01145 [Stellaceae bacterium]|nr:hypothetical protein [Stellaceae bacterium]